MAEGAGEATTYLSATLRRRATEDKTIWDAVPVERTILIESANEMELLRSALKLCAGHAKSGNPDAACRFIARIADQALSNAVTRPSS